MSYILLVDGDRTYRTVLQTALQNLGYRVEMAQSVREMAVVLGAEPLDVPGLIILDWFLPDGGAREAIRWLRATRIAAPILVLAAAEAFERVRSQAEQTGETVVLSKSGPLKRVQRTVAHLLKAPTNSSFPLQLDGNLVRRLAPPYPATPLTSSQADLLQVLLEQPPGQFVSAVVLASRLIIYTYGTESARARLVAKRVSRLRVRLAPLGVLIESQRGQGYRLTLVPLVRGDV
ncbi:MAG: response regulator [Chloroflexi bacterium]|nr:response regulator [Chloroflexota bacterium]MBU1747341.1 response regulator [Chloroflexota bacterium]